MPMPGYGARYWAERTPVGRRVRYPAFRGEHQADVVVIGGGIVGVTAAYVLAKGGLDVILLEADRVAAGSTSAGLGAILPEPDAWFRDVQKAAGVRLARSAWQQSRRSSLDMASLLRRIGARAEVTTAPLVIAPAAGADLTALKREHAERKAAGVDAAWLHAAAALASSGLECGGAIRLHDGCTFDPV